MRVEGPGFRVQGSGFRVQGPGFRVEDSGFRVQGPGFRVQGSGFGHVVANVDELLARHESRPEEVVKVFVVAPLEHLPFCERHLMRKGALLRNATHPLVRTHILIGVRPVQRMSTWTLSNGTYPKCVTVVS